MSKNNSNKKSRSNSVQKTNYLPKNLVGGFIRGSTPVMTYGQNPLYSYQSQDLFNSCNGDCNSIKVGGMREKTRKISRKSSLYYRYI